MAQKISLTAAMDSLYPNNPNWTAGVTKEEFENGTWSYSNLDWRDLNVTKPTKEAIQAEILRLSTEGQYKLDRVEAYPSIEDQLDAIYHGGVAGWKADIKAVKDANPKPV